jgi:hypothetical protein
MNSDCVYRIGRGHAVCQDYAVAGAGVHPYVILADGCSSSPDTDIGARLLVKAAERFLDRFPGSHGAASGLDPYHRGAICSARAHAALLGLSDRSLDSTLLTAVVRGPAWHIAMYGDGVVAVKDRQGRISIKSVSFAEGYPDYPNYGADQARRQAFLARTGNRRTVETVVLEPDDSVSERDVSTEPGAEACYCETGDVAGCEWIAVMSDGVHSFTQPVSSALSCARQPVALPEVLRELLAFKSTTGVFVQRRVQRFLQQCTLRGWQHHDDLSVGVIYLGG